MDNKIFGYIGIGLIIVGIIFAGLMIKNQSDLLGATVNYSNSLSQTNLYNSLESLLSDINRVRLPLSGMVTSSTAQIVWPSVGAASTTATSTQVVGLAALQGDLVFLSPSTSTASTTYSISVLTASSTSATFTIVAHNGGSAAVTPTATDFKLTVLPRATFLVPGALVTSSSTSN